MVTTTLRVAVDLTTAIVADASKTCSFIAALPAFQEAMATRPGRTAASVARFPSRKKCVDGPIGISTLVPSSSLTSTTVAVVDCTIPRALPACPCGGCLPSGFALAGGEGGAAVAGAAAVASAAATARPATPTRQNVVRERLIRSIVPSQHYPMIPCA